MQREVGIKASPMASFAGAQTHHFSLRLLCPQAHARVRHIFYVGVFDNLDGMKFVSPGECCLRHCVLDSSHSAFHGLPVGHPDVQSAQLQASRGLVPLRGACHSMRTVASAAIERIVDVHGAGVEQAKADSGTAGSRAPRTATKTMVRADRPTER